MTSPKLFIAFVTLCGAAFSQTPRFELGLQLGGIRESALGEYPVTAGGRVTVHAFSFIDADAEVNRHPVGGAVALYPATEATLGARVGHRFGPFGIYGILRPGLMRFDANPRIPNLGTRAELDFGAVLEFYSRRHIAGRVDLGDAAVWYGDNNSGASGVRNQLRWGLGVSIWF